MFQGEGRPQQVSDDLQGKRALTYTLAMDALHGMAPGAEAFLCRTVEAEAVEPDAESWIGPPQFVLTTQLERLLERSECSWQFDAFELAQACSNQGLSVLAFHLIKVDQA